MEKGTYEAEIVKAISDYFDETKELWFPTYVVVEIVNNIRDKNYPLGKVIIVKKLQGLVLLTTANQIKEVLI